MTASRPRFPMPRLLAPRFLILAGGAALLSATTGIAFAAWAEHGAGIFLAMAANGLSWCF